MSSFNSPKIHLDHGPLHHLHQRRNNNRNIRSFSLKNSQHHQNSSCSSSSPSQQCQTNRRSLVLLATTTLSLPPPISTASTTITTPPTDTTITTPPTDTTITTPPKPPIDTTITDRIFLDFNICPTYFRTDQAQDLPPCPASEPMGRVILGLYGKVVPITVSNFKAMCNKSNSDSSSGSSPSSSYKNSLVHKILPGQYFVAGRQGERREKGAEFKPPLGLLAQNVETVDSKAFMLKHSRAGILSLCLGENDDDEDIKLDPEYRNVEFLITTGPGPCPQLDNRNIVFGVVLEGMDVVRNIAAVPTYEPGERIQQFNKFANLIGDERAKNARNLWNRPLKTVYISDCGELEVTKPSLSPSLP